MRTRLAPDEIPNDGKQTPMKGHPVFLDRHATATCCRRCLEKWHRILILGIGKNDLHIHVLAGSVPKDGPSAGITLTTAVASLVNGKTVSPKIAMTGEVSLRGCVMPIGGLPEKLMAAQRAGITTVFIPQENEDDLDEVAAEVKKNLEIIPVHMVSDVLEKTGLPASGSSLKQTKE